MPSRVTTFPAAIAIVYAPFPIQSRNTEKRDLALVHSENEHEENDDVISCAPQSPPEIAGHMVHHYEGRRE
jgi:hypothetical protein